jgi:Asp-tRNA(Asn)/Glu-tRNA(Gln) amidotransferase A subunit family amidase
MMNDPLPTIAQAQQHLRDGRLSATDLVERCLAAIERYEADIRAWVVVDRDGALAAADRLDREGRQGDFRGPLHGIPVGIKDLIDVAGWPTRAGSSLSDDQPVATDAPVVAQLRKAGAIILGKTVTTEFGCFDPPPTRNPWNLAHTPGGSSSGSAAAVATGMCVAALGTQTGGSIIRPASYCGVCGLKPTFGRVTTAGVFPISQRLDHVGCLARTTEDLLRVFQVIAEPAPTAAHSAAKPSDLRFAMLAEFFSDAADDETRAACDLVGNIINAAGWRLDRATLPASFARLHEMHRRLMAADAARNHQRWFPAHRDRYGPKMIALLDDGLRVSPTQYDEAVAHQRYCREEFARWAADYHALLTPATPSPAPADRSTTGDASFNSPFSYTGLPVLSLPVALSSGGLPIAVQLIGAPDSEPRLAGLAAELERQTDMPRLPLVLTTNEP